MRRFRRHQPLHQRLAEEADLAARLADPGRPPSLAAETPGWDGEPRGEPGIHGVPRARRWDAVATAESPLLRGDTVHFVSLADRTLLVEEDEPDDGVSPLADAVDALLSPPYRAEAVRRTETAWAVGASRIEVAEVRGLTGDDAELAVTRQGRALQVDGRTVLGRAPALERLGAALGAEYVVRGRRLDGDLWEVEATAL
ncbi:MAG TPA: hypothetical protein VGP69_13740 [Gaiellaceae bacterium]|nr:hypothetical protein [Gaiellaceae bacterium]